MVPAAKLIVLHDGTAKKNVLVNVATAFLVVYCTLMSAVLLVTIKGEQAQCQPISHPH